MSGTSLDAVTDSCSVRQSVCQAGTVSVCRFVVKLAYLCSTGRTTHTHTHTVCHLLPRPLRSFLCSWKEPLGVCVRERARVCLGDPIPRASSEVRLLFFPARWNFCGIKITDTLLAAGQSVDGAKAGRRLMPPGAVVTLEGSRCSVGLRRVTVDELRGHPHHHF